ncbi:MAG: DUF3667 domain-containing protein [Bacteroidia bacterium]
MDHSKTSDEPAGNRCLNCSNSFTGSYCNRCGEKILEPQEKTIRHFLEEFVQAITFADNKLWRTVKLLYTRPGVLPRKHMEGLRKPFIAPLALFFIVNLLYFFFQPVDSFNSYYSSQVKHQKYSEWAAPVAKNQRVERGWTEEYFEQQYNLHSSNLSKLMLILLPVMFSFPLLLLFNSRKYYYIDHLAFALSFIAFLFLTFFIVAPYLLSGIVLLINKLSGSNISLDINDGKITLAVLLLAAIYLSIAMRNFYQQAWWWLVPKALLLMVSFIVIMLLYRFILFVVTVYTV